MATCEVVEDSEPERQERKRRRRQEEHTRTGNASVSREQDIHVKHKCSGGIGEPDDLNRRSSQKPSEGPSGPRECSAPRLIEHSTNEEDELGLMQLSRFAYQSSSSQPNPVRRSAPPPSIPNCARPKAQAEPTPRGPSDAQLSNLSKCVCCSLQWTTKKTVQQKKMHIEQCAKKQGIADDTLLALVNKETNASTSSPVGNNAGENATLMRDIVSAETSKKGRRKQVIGTVRSLPETRRSILGKAKDILGQIELSNVCDDRLGTTVDDNEPTQQFGKSTLACRNPSKSHSKMDIEPPGATQPFSESALCKRTSRMFDAYMEASMTCKRPPSPSLEDVRNVKARTAQGT